MGVVAPPSASTRSGSVAPFSPRSPPSSRCGSPRRSTTSPALPSSIASASEVPEFRAFVFRSLGAQLELHNGVWAVRQHSTERRHRQPPAWARGIEALVLLLQYAGEAIANCPFRYKPR